MKLLKYTRLLCAAAALAAICVLAGCQKAEPQVNGPELPLEDQVLTDTLEQVGLDWVIAEDESYSSREGQFLHSLRSPEKTYPGTDNPMLYAGVISAMVDGERYLNFSFMPESAAGFDPSVSQPFAWEDWEDHLKLAALLYGFEDENELYEAVCQEELSEENFLSWEKQLTGGYCRVRVRPMDRKNFTGDRYLVYVTIYQSKDLCEDLDTQNEQYQKELQERQEALKKEKEEMLEKERSGSRSAG